MLEYDYFGEGFLDGNTSHCVMVIKQDGVIIANGLGVTDNRGRVIIRIFNYIKRLESEIRGLFNNIRDIDRIVFTEPVEG